jgi:hypothetical protein
MEEKLPKGLKPKQSLIVCCAEDTAPMEYNSWHNEMRLWHSSGSLEPTWWLQLVSKAFHGLLLFWNWHRISATGVELSDQCGGGQIRSRHLADFREGQSSCGCIVVCSQCYFVDEIIHSLLSRHSLIISEWRASYGYITLAGPVNNSRQETRTRTQTHKSLSDALRISALQLVTASRLALREILRRTKRYKGDTWDNHLSPYASGDISSQETQTTIGYFPDAINII